jgi:sugar phosphate isomerase/epimerase
MSTILKFSVSNIAWDKENDKVVLSQLSNYGVTGIELAPTVIFNNWEISGIKAKEYKKKLESFGFGVPAFQSILFGKPELQLFCKSCRETFKEHIKKVAELANIFGARVLIFGAPKNRLRNQIAYIDAEKMAVEILSELADICVKFGCCIGLEANPKEYSCDFITNILDAKRIVSAVNKQGLKLHFDSGGAYMCGGSILDVIRTAKGFVHYHISEPMLVPIVRGVIEHKAILNALKDIMYDGWVSIEMKKPLEQELLFKSVRFIANILNNLNV